MQLQFKKTILKFLLVGIAFLAFPPAYALRCGTSLVQLGDTKAKVQFVCGKPAAKEQISKQVYANGQAAVSSITQWTYNFGPNDFLYLLSFNGGRLIHIETNGYGY